MNTNIISSRSFEEPSEKKCKVCDDPPHISFNWQFAQKNENHALHALSDQLKQVKSLKFGELYACQLCGANWVLDEKHYMMSRVPNDRRDILNEWNENHFPIGQEHLRILDTIGGTTLNYWGGYDGVIAIPCAIIMRSGEHIDPAVIWITKRSPIDRFPNRFMFYRDVDSIEPSRFALPLDVRCATALAGEVCMGFAPTRVVATNGTPFVLHWATSLFNQDGITGSEIRLSFKRFNRDESITIAKTDSDHATYFFADWFEGAEKLDKTSQSKSRIRKFLDRLF
jgi:hypothetical protein